MDGMLYAQLMRSISEIKHDFRYERRKEPALSAAEGA